MCDMKKHLEYHTNEPVALTVGVGPILIANDGSFGHFSVFDRQMWA